MSSGEFSHNEKHWSPSLVSCKSAFLLGPLPLQQVLGKAPSEARLGEAAFSDFLSL